MWGVIARDRPEVKVVRAALNVSRHFHMPERNEGRE